METEQRDQAPEHPKVLLTPEHAAEALSISRWKLYELLRTGRLRSVRIGTCRRIPTQALDDLIADLHCSQPGWHS